MQHPINISVINDAVGVSPSSDGVMGLFCKAVAVPGSFELNKAYLLTSSNDLALLGINAPYDDNNSVAVFQQVSEFYAQAGDGALLWLFGVSKDTAYAAFVGDNTFSDLIRFTAQADPANRVKMVGLCYEVPKTTQSLSDFPGDVTNTITALETVRIDLFNQGYQFSAIVDGYRMSSDVTPATIGTMANKAAPGISVCITGTKPNGISGVGLALGRFSRISIGRGFGAVEDGPVNSNSAFLTNSIVITPAGDLTVDTIYTVQGGEINYNNTTYTIGKEFTAVAGKTSFTSTENGYVVENFTPVAGLRPVYIDQLGSKQYMFLRTWFNNSGFFWNDGATCELSTKQLSTQEYNRVANALTADALAFFIKETGKNLPLDIVTGNVDAGYIKAKQVEFYDTYISPLTVKSGSGDLSDGGITITGTNFNSTKEIQFELDLVPTPIVGKVRGKIRFSGTL